MEAMSDPFGDAVRADAEAARAAIRAVGVCCPSCGANVADLPRGHELSRDGYLPGGTVKCGEGARVALDDYDSIKAACNVILWDDFNASMDEAKARFIGGPRTKPWEGFLSVLADPPG